MRLASIKEILMLQSRKIIQKTKFTQEALLFVIPGICTGAIFPYFAKDKKLRKRDLSWNYVIRVTAWKKKHISVSQGVLTYGSWGHHSLKSSSISQKENSLFFVLLQYMVLYMQICLNTCCSIGFNLLCSNFLVMLTALNVACAVEWGI